MNAPSRDNRFPAAIVLSMHTDLVVSVFGMAMSVAVSWVSESHTKSTISDVAFVVFCVKILVILVAQEGIKQKRTSYFIPYLIYNVVSLSVSAIFLFFYAFLLYLMPSGGSTNAATKPQDYGHQIIDTQPSESFNFIDNLNRQYYTNLLKGLPETAFVNLLFSFYIIVVIRKYCTYSKTANEYVFDDDTSFSEMEAGNNLPSSTGSTQPFNHLEPLPTYEEAVLCYHELPPSYDKIKPPPAYSEIVY